MTELWSCIAMSTIDPILQKIADDIGREYAPYVAFHTIAKSLLAAHAKGERSAEQTVSSLRWVFDEIEAQRTGSVKGTETQS